MWFNFAVRTILAAITAASLNKHKRASLRSKLIEVRDAINELYGLK